MYHFVRHCDSTVITPSPFRHLVSPRCEAKKQLARTKMAGNINGGLTKCDRHGDAPKAGTSDNHCPPWQRSRPLTGFGSAVPDGLLRRRGAGRSALDNQTRTRLATVPSAPVSRITRACTAATAPLGASDTAKQPSKRRVRVPQELRAPWYKPKQREDLQLPPAFPSIDGFVDTTFSDALLQKEVSPRVTFVPWTGFDASARRCANNWKEKMQQLHPQIVTVIEGGFAMSHECARTSIFDDEWMQSCSWRRIL